jgi:Trypsin-like peptidase domain
VFSNAVDTANKFTRPVVISTRTEAGKVEGGLAAFVVLNQDGWVLTAAHVWGPQVTADQHQVERKERDGKVAAINANRGYNPDRKRREIRRLPANPNWLTNVSYWWAADGAKAVAIHLSPLADLALVKLDGFPIATIAAFPTFGNPGSHITPGTALCKLGFPLSKVEASWDTAANTFRLGSVAWPVFPLDGMMTRSVNIEDAPTGTVAKYIETSTPGLRGQSGGPYFDVDARVWAIQSRTMHYELGFSPKVKDGGREVSEHQFLNVGWGADVEEVVKLTAAHGVHIDIAP